MHASPCAAMRPSPHVALSLTLALCAMAIACRTPPDDQTPMPSDRGVRGTLAGETTAMPPATQPVAPRWQDPMLAHPSEARPAMARVEPRALTETVTTPGAPVLGAPPRDLAAELRSNTGDLSSCVSAVELAALPNHVELELEAMVTPSGVVSRSDVRASALSEAALRCLRARVGAARFTAPVPDAPRRVTARLVFDRRAAPAP